MRSLPPLVVYSVVVPLIMLSPIIGFFLAMAAAIVIGMLMDAGTSVRLLLGAGFAGLILFRRLRTGRGGEKTSSAAAG